MDYSPTMAEKEPEINFNELIRSNDVRIANLCTGTRADGSDFYVYLLQNILQADALQKAIMIGASVDFAQYGEVIAHGEGVEPSEEVKRKVEEEHGLDHSFEEKLVGEYKALEAEFEKMKKRGISREDFLKKKIKEFSEQFDK